MITSKSVASEAKNDVFKDELIDAFADLKLERDTCYKNLESCESAFEQSLQEHESQISWYQEPGAIVGIGAVAFVLGVLLGANGKK